MCMIMSRIQKYLLPTIKSSDELVDELVFPDSEYKIYELVFFVEESYNENNSVWSKFLEVMRTKL